MSKLKTRITGAKSFTEREEQLIKTVVQAQQAKIKQRIEHIPLLTPLLGAFGLVSLFYGLEKLLDRSAFADRPIEMIIFGMLILLLTGAYYRKL